MSTKIKKTLQERKNELIAKENKSTFDFVKLANVEDKIENKTASKVYKNVIASKYVFEILGKKEIPTFKEFLKKLKVKDNYSNWDGFNALAKFNIKYQTSKRVTRQNKKEANK